MISGNYDTPFARSVGILSSSDPGINDDDIRSAVANVAFSDSAEVDPVLASPAAWQAMLVADPEGTRAAAKFAYQWDFSSTPQEKAILVLRNALMRGASGTFDDMYAAFGADAAAGAAGRAAALHARRTGAEYNGGLK